MENSKEINNENEKLVEFFMNIDDGFAIRHFFVAIGIVKPELTMKLTKKSIEFDFKDETEQGYHSIRLDPSKFAQYDCNFIDEDGTIKQEEEYTFKTEEMVSSIKGISRQDGVIIYKQLAAHSIVLNPQKNATRDQERQYASYVNTHAKCHEEDCLEEHQYSDTENFKTRTKDFSDFCSSAAGRKCDSVTLKIYENGGEFNAYLPDRRIASQIRYGIINDHEINESEFLSSNPNIKISNPSIYGEVNIPIQIIKSLAKFANFSHKNSYIRFTAEKGKPIKISVDIGTFGVYNLYIVSKNKFTTNKTKRK